MELRGGVLVGLGDHAEALPELEWGAREAVVRGTPLHLVRAYHLTAAAGPWGAEYELLTLDDLRAAARRRLDAAADLVRREWPHEPVDVHAVEGLAPDVLTKASSGALLTVLGSRQLGPISGLFLGSVSTVVAATAHSPVVVVGRTGRVPVREPAVVVGLDGSPTSTSALGFAIDHAIAHHRPVLAVYCMERGDGFDRDGPREAERWLGDAVEPWQAKHPDLTIRTQVVTEHPVAGLVQSSAGQDVLIVGRGRSRHPRIAALLGSVALGVLHHAECPVVLVS